MTLPSFALLLLLSISILPISGLPTIAIVPGAWQSPIHYTKLTTLLRSEGYTVVSRPHPSVDSLIPATRTAAGDAAAIHDNVLSSLIEDEGEDVVLVMHGYGGLVGSAATVGWSRVERRQKGLPGGIIGMIFIAAFLSRSGGSMVGLLPGGRLEEWVVQYPDHQTFPSTHPSQLFYNDLLPRNPDLAALFAHELRNQSLNSLTTLTGIPPAWANNAHYANRRAYGFTVKDQVVPLATQEAMAGLAGVDFVSRYFDAGHSPFLSVPEEVAEWIAGLALVWEYRRGGGGSGTGGQVAVA